MAIERRKRVRPKEIIFYWLPPIGYMALIFYMSSQPLEEFQLPDVWNIDKVAHFIEYGVLGIIWFRALNTVSVNSKQIVFVAFAITFLYGISDEIHQHFVPNRNSSIYDAIADGIGAWVGIWLYKRR
ncbi:MAG: VanZ family protein [Deltaproteobacteria bacterium]|nr:VanZ family protein [Deltaproteobacteria bacterium]